jgi:hypothetical protein
MTSISTLMLAAFILAASLIWLTFLDGVKK